MPILFFDFIILIFIILSSSLETDCVRLRYFCYEFLRKIMYSWAKTCLTTLIKYCKSTGSSDDSFVDFSLQKLVNSVVYVPPFPTAIPAWAAVVPLTGREQGGPRCAQANVGRTRLPVGHLQGNQKELTLNPCG